jgi:TMEM175 potassium channel family protein
MSTRRLEAFSDGVIAILITIMVLQLTLPMGDRLGDLHSLVPVLLSYVLSFIYLAIYWNNHHHMLSVTEGVSGAVLWANMHLLFWLSLVPFATRWIGQYPSSSTPAAVYGVVLIMAAIAYYILVRAIIAGQGKDSLLAVAVGKDFKGTISVVLYAAAIPLAFVQVWIAYALYVAVALIWLIPDRRIERVVAARAVRVSE